MNKKSLIFTILMVYFFCALPSTIHAFALRGWGGTAWLHDTIKDYDVKYDTGYACGAIYENTWFCFLKTEVEFFYLHSNISDIRARSIRTGVHGSMDNYTTMFNLAVQYPIKIENFHFSPYLGAGIGGSYTKTQLHAGSLPSQRETEHRVSYQYFGGISFPICSFYIGEISANIEGRYFIFDKHVRAILAIGGLSLKF